MEVNYARGIWVCRFGKHSKFSMMHCRKCKFVLIDVKVGLLLTFLASMKAKVHVRLYQKYVSVFGRLDMKSSIFKYPFSRSPLRSLGSSLHFEYVFSSFVSKWKAKTDQMFVSVLKMESCKWCPIKGASSSNH